MEFFLFIVGSTFAILFIGVCWIFVFLGCLLEFLRCIFTFHFVDMPQRLQCRATELKECGHGLAQMCADCFSDEDEDEPPCYE